MQQRSQYWNVQCIAGTGAMAKLDKYRSMRDFGVTPEPAGGKPGRSGSPIFVVQKHAATRLHYDFRLEIDGVLKSWAVPKGPSYDPSVRRLAMMTEDHPYDYARFEGVIPAGNYGAGNVIIWDHGTWRFEGPGDDPAKAVSGGKLTFSLDGMKLKGEWALVRMEGKSENGNEWLLLKHRDEWATGEVDVTDVAPFSVVSGKEIDQVGDGETGESNRKARKVRTVAEKASAGGRSSTTRKKPAAKKAAKTKGAKSSGRRRKGRDRPAK